MSDVVPQQKATPSRRRQPRTRQGKAGAHKAYASENDAGVAEASLHGTPQTPSKMEMISPDIDPQSAQGSKQRSKPRNKPRNQVASPELARTAHHTPPPPQRSASSKSGSAAAFAGATFHASPAPSALPIPSFLSRSSNESPANKSNHLVQEPSPPTTDTEVPTPRRPTSVSRPHESPLDFMFRAHRQEKEKQRQDTFQTQNPTLQRRASPSSQSPFELSSSPKAPESLHSRFAQARQQNVGIGSAELDGTPGHALGPAFSTPYQERIKAARSLPTKTGFEQTPSKQAGVEPPVDPTEALKKFLFSGKSSSDFGSPNNLSTSPASRPTGAYAHPQAAPSAEPIYTRNANIHAMENDLRRILKLDLNPGSSKP